MGISGQQWSNDLGNNIAELKAQIRDNERIWSGFRNIELNIIGAHSLRELVALLIQGTGKSFSDVDCATVACVDPDYSLARMVEQEKAPHLPPGTFVPISRADLTGLFAELPRPRLDRCNSTIQSLLFPAYPQHLGSMALMPLILRGQLIGSFNQASRHPMHYDPRTATDFLEHLAAITALCIDNVINRERLKLDGLTDALTNIANRRFFERRLREELTRWRRRGGALICMLVDIDHFKQVNDKYGHQIGDQVLRQVSDMLGRDLRASDVLARYGGEEFVLLLPETSEKQGIAIAQRLREMIERAQFASDAGAMFAVTVSIGLAMLDRRSQQVPENIAEWLLREADAALYRAKQGGRNKLVVAGTAA
jgi:two-component system cell cycle response regulator